MLTIFKEISVKNFWQMVLDFKTFLKEECVRVVPFAKYQITVGPGLKQMMHLPPQGEVWLHWLTGQMIQKILIISVKMEKGSTSKGVAFIRKTYIEMNHFIWILPGITGFSIQMVSAQGLFSLHNSHMLMFRIIFIFLVIRNIGYYMALRRCEISLRVLKNISQVSAANEWNIFSTREEKFRISKRPCNVLFII